MGNNSVKFFLLLSFIEGLVVMGTELLGAKMLAPFFGSSLYVWSSVMAITLGGLAFGYFFGGKISLREKQKLNLYKILLIGSLFTMLMPFTSKVALNIIGFYSLLPAVFCSTFIVLFPPVFLMGMVSPIIIKIISKNTNESGNSAGTVYAISTFGGIISTLAFGFYVIPVYGLTMPAIISGATLGILPLIMLVKKKRYSDTLPFVIGIIISLYQLIFDFNQPREGVDLIYKSEGILGQISVYDYSSNNFNKAGNNSEKVRWLYVNGISQTKENRSINLDENSEKYFTYVPKLTDYISSLNLKNKSVLLLGLGGGSLAKSLFENGYNVEVCELDKRINYVAKTYFDLPETINVTVDDARHFIKLSKNKYDVIIFDTFRGEETPSHIITKESLVEVKKILNKDGHVLINSYNYIEGKKGVGLQSIYKTLIDANLSTEVWPTSIDVNNRNLLFISSLNKVEKNEEFLDMSKIDISKAQVLTDEYPAFEMLNGLAGLDWRISAINNNQTTN